MSPIEGEEVESARGVWWGASDVALPSPNLGTNKGRSVSGNVVSVLSPTMTNEALVTFSRLKLDNTYKDPAKMSLVNYSAVELQRPVHRREPVPARRHPVTGAGGVGNMWSAANDMYAHNDALQFSDKLTKIAGAHGLKFGVSLERGCRSSRTSRTTRKGYVVFDAWLAAGHDGQRGRRHAGRPSRRVPARARDRPRASAGSGTSTCSRRTPGSSART